MPLIYLSPSTQEYNQFVIGGTEEEYMNRIADAMVPYLRSSGINYVRSTLDMTAADAIYASNQGNYDLNIALHSNSAPAELAGTLRGTDVYYYPESSNGQRAAEIIAENFKEIYPIPSLVAAVPTTTLGEVTRTKAPSVLVEVAYHDNVEDATWISNNVNTIAENLVFSLTEYFGIPFLTPQPERVGVVNIDYGHLNVRSRPQLFAPVLTTVNDGERITVLGRYGEWYLVDVNGVLGYASANYITL